MAAPTEQDLLRASIDTEKARAEAQRALAGLFNTLRDVALDLRDLARREAARG